MKYNTYLTIKKSIQYPKFGGFNNGHRTQPIQPEFILEKLLLDLETEDPQIPRSTLSYRHLYNCRGFFTNQPFFNKQSQFPKKSNECKYLFTKGL